MARTLLALLLVLAVVSPTAAQPASDIPVPKPRPDLPGEANRDGGEAATARQGGEDSGSEEKQAAPAARPTPLRVRALADCEARLEALGVEFEALGPVEGENGCGFAAGYNVTEINGIAVRPSTRLRCETIVALAQWLRHGVEPAVRGWSRAEVAREGEPVTLTGIRHGSTYVCRRRNNQPDGKLSYHAVGAAIDIIAFEFVDRAPVGIEPRAGRGTLEEAFQRAARGSACLHFTTVLGPGSDAYHDDHLHLDIAHRRGGFRLCQ